MQLRQYYGVQCAEAFDRMHRAQHTTAKRGWRVPNSGAQVCCSSPERFLRGGRGRTLEARPIKVQPGTLSSGNTRMSAPSPHAGGVSLLLTTKQECRERGLHACLLTM